MKIPSWLDKLTGGSGEVDDNEDRYIDPAEAKEKTEKAEPERHPQSVDKDPDPFADDTEESAEPQPAPGPASESTSEPAPAPEPQTDPEDKDRYAEPTDHNDPGYCGAPVFAGYALRFWRSYPSEDGSNVFCDSIDVQEVYTREHSLMTDEQIVALMSQDMADGKLALKPYRLDFSGNAVEEIPSDSQIAKALFEDYGVWLKKADHETDAPAQAEESAEPQPAPEPASESTSEPAPAPPPAPQTASEFQPEKDNPPVPAPAPAVEPQEEDHPSSASTEEPPSPPKAEEVPQQSAPSGGIDLGAMTSNLSEKDRALFLQTFAQSMVAQLNVSPQAPQPASPSPAEPAAPQEVKLPPTCGQVNRAPEVLPPQYE